jgi:hypothetical protein
MSFKYLVAAVKSVWMTLSEHLYGQIKPQLMILNVLHRFVEILHVYHHNYYIYILQLGSKKLHAKNLKNRDVEHVIR